MAVVIDTSYVMALTMPDEATPRSADEVLRQDLLAPFVWPIEVANAARKAVRRRRITMDMAEAAMSAVRKVGVAVEPETSESAAYYLSLAHRYDLSAWDALYLDLALRGEHDLATQDAPMIAVAERMGIKVHR